MNKRILIIYLIIISVFSTFSFVYATPILWSVGDGGNGHYYQYFFDELLTWHEAKAKAESFGGYLATITSQEENDWITNTFPLGSAPNPYGSGQHFENWIGGYQDRSAPEYSEPSGGWKWVTGEPMNFINWNYPYQPDNWHSPNGYEDYLSIYPTGKWNDYAQLAPYLVEWNSNPIPEPSSMLLFGPLLIGFIGLGYKKKISV